MFARFAEAELCGLGSAHQTASFMFLELTMKVAEDMVIALFFFTIFVVGRLPTMSAVTFSTVPNSRAFGLLFTTKNLGTKS